MELFLSIVKMVFGSVLLYFGADYLVRGAVGIAKKAGISSMVIGLTVVALGTSAPELVVSVSAALKGSSDIALGNVVGSNICNVGLILGLSAMIRALPASTGLLKFDIPCLLGASALLTGFCLFGGGLNRFAGILFFVLMILYFVRSVVQGRRSAAQESAEEGKTEPPKGFAGKYPLTASFLFTGGGLAALVFGANIFVDGSVTIARMLNISEAVIALTLVAVGTSLPELATSVVAAFKGQSDIALGNVVGSNLFNILAILGITAMITPVSAGGITAVDFVMMLLSTVVLIPILLTGKVVSRAEGTFLFLCYAGYVAYLVAMSRGGIAAIQ